MLLWIAGDFVEGQKMSQVFEGYERQYCEISANLSKKITAASVLNGGETLFPVIFEFLVRLYIQFYQLDCYAMITSDKSDL